MADLATLVVRLTADISELKAGVTRAREEIQGFGSFVANTAKIAAEAFAIFYTIKEAFSFGDKIIEAAAHFQELSHAVGIATDSLSEFAYAAKLQGIDDISTPLERLARSAGNVVEGNAKATQAFRALGVSIKDASGNIKGADQLLLDVSDAMSKYNDGLAKTKISQELFGRSGAGFIAFLDQGAKKIEAAKQEAVDFGVDVPPAFAAASKAIEDDMKRMGAALEGVFMRALKDLAPQLEEGTHNIEEFLKELNSLPEVNAAVLNTLKLLLAAITAIGTAIAVVVREFVLLADVIIDINKLAYAAATALADPKHALENIGKAAQEMKKDVADGLHSIGTLEVEGKNLIVDLLREKTDAEKRWALAAANATDLANQKLKDLDLPNDKLQKGIESALEALIKMDEKLKETVATFGLSGAAATAYSLTVGELASQIDRLNHLSPKEAIAAVEALQQAGKITKVQQAELNDEINRGVQIGTKYKESILESAQALDKLKAGDALSKFDTELLTITGHFDELAKAAFELSSRPIKVAIQIEADKSTLPTDLNERQVAVGKQLTKLDSARNRVENELAQSIRDVQAAGQAEGKGALQILGEEAAARSNAISQLEDLRAEAVALFEVTGSPEALAAAQKYQDTISKIKFSSDYLQGAQLAYERTLKIADATRVLQAAEEQLSVTSSALNAERSQGQINDIQLMNEQDAATNKLIATYQEQLAVFKELHKEDPFDPAVVAQANRMITTINNLKASTNQLVNVIRQDFESAATDAFVGFATGAQTASQAIHQFLDNVEKQLLTLASKSLFQTLFGDIQKALGLGTETGVAITEAMTLGGTTAGAEISAAMIAAGSIVAEEITAAAAVGGGGGIGGLSGDALGASLWSLSGITGLAGGGSFQAGRPYIVGEHGPELMLPAMDGQIVPSDQWGKGGTTIVNNFHIVAPQGTVSRATQAQIAAQAALSVQAASARNN